MYKDKKISTVFPAYNEEDNIKSAVEDFFSTGVIDGVIVVDNNARDNTASKVAQTNARLVKEQRQGYGFALRRGMREAGGALSSKIFHFNKYKGII